MKSSRFSVLKSVIIISTLTLVGTIFAERSNTIKYQCAERSQCKCSEGVYDPFYTGIITIDCRNLNLTRVPALIGIPNFKYYRFLLRDNHITSVNSRDFRYNMFIEIDLGGENPLVQVADKAFLATSRFLKRLKLNISKINIYKLRFLHSVPKILELTLENTDRGRKTSLPSRVFPGYKLKAMRKLTLTGFSFTKIAPDAFLGVSNLRILCLSRNNLTSVPSAALRGLKWLSELDLSYNSLKTLERNPFGQLKRLSKLNLSGNLFEDPGAIAPDAFTDLKKCLTNLILTNSSLRTIPSQSLRNLKALSHLNLSDNLIENLRDNPYPFMGDYKLRHLDISGNRLSLSEILFRGLSASLRSLSVRRMRLKELPRELFRNFTRLHHLDMSGNLLTHLPDGFNKGIHARHFILRNMHINRVSGKAFVKPSVTAKLLVDLSSNRLASVKFISETLPCTFIEVVLFDNPVLCDCDLFSVVSDDTIHVRGRCSGGGNHFRNVSVTDHALRDTLRRVCVLPASSVAPCRRQDAQWRAHKQFSGVGASLEKLKLLTIFIGWVLIYIFDEIHCKN